MTLNDKWKIFFVTTYVLGLMAIGAIIGFASAAVTRTVRSDTEISTQTVAKQVIPVTDEKALEQLAKEIELEINKGK